MRKFVLDHCKEQSLHARFTNAFKDTKQPVGWVIARRPYNMPCEVTIPLIVC